MGQVELFRSEFNLLTDWGIEVASFLEEHFEVLSGECNEFLLLWLSPYDLLDKVLQDPWELIGDVDLLSCEDSHVFDVGHFQIFILFV